MASDDDFSGRIAPTHSAAIAPDQIGGPTRFYRREFPDIEECVVVNVRSIADMGAYVQLLEYNNIEGMILLSELSRRRIRSINKLIRVGRNEVVMVLRVDREKGYIDLSKRRVSPDEIRRTEERFNKAKTVHSIIKHVSQRLQVPMLSLYTRLGWPLYERHGHAYDAFQLAVTEPDAVLSGLEITDKERGELVTYVNSRMTPQPLKVRTDIQVTCFQYEGIEAVREALLAGQAHTTEKVPISVQLIAPPLYVMTTQCLDKVAGIDALTAAIASIKRVIESKGGALNVKMPPTVTSAAEESELSRMLADLEAANAEVSGDDEVSGSDSEEDDGDDDAAAVPGVEGAGAGAGAGGSGDAEKKA